MLSFYEYYDMLLSKYFYYFVDLIVDLIKKYFVSKVLFSQY